MVTPDKKSEKKRYVIYTRCSTDDQAQGDFTTLDAQAHHCKNMLDAFGHDLAIMLNITHPTFSATPRAVIYITIN